MKQTLVSFKRYNSSDNSVLGSTVDATERSTIAG